MPTRHWPLPRRALLTLIVALALVTGGLGAQAARSTTSHWSDATHTQPGTIVTLRLSEGGLPPSH
jgi:hypothetical protein